MPVRRGPPEWGTGRNHPVTSPGTTVSPVIWPPHVRGGQTSSRMPAMISTLAAGVAASMQTRSITRR